MSLKESTNMIIVVVLSFTKSDASYIETPFFKESFIVDTHKTQLGRIINYTPLQNILSNMTTTLTGVRLC